MDLFRSHRTYDRILSSRNHGRAREDTIRMNTLPSREMVELESSDGSQSMSNSVYRPLPDLHQNGDQTKQSTTTIFSGWRLGAWTAACLAITSLVINLAAAIYLATHPSARTSLVEVHEGDCNKVESLDLWLHFIINLISTLLLGGSNYCMQCLCSPSRNELDYAHAKGVPLDIGVPSPRNLSSIGKLKQALWWILAISSIPLHLIYNSAFYTSIAARDYSLYVVQPDFLTGNVTYNHIDPNYSTSASQETNSVPNPRTLYNYYDTNSSQFKKLTNRECITTYARVISTGWGTLLLVTSKSSSNYSVVAAEAYTHDWIGHAYQPYDWICTGDPDLGSKVDLSFMDPNDESRSVACDDYVSKIEAVADEWVVLNEPIDYCLAEPAEQHCTLSGNLPIVVVVLICNFIKAVVMILVASRLPGDPLITVGDAIQSFLDKPDPTTKNLCWTTRREILDYATYAYHYPRAPWPANTVNATAETRTVSLRDRRWFNAAGYTRWVSTVVFLLIALSGSIVCFVIGYIGLFMGSSTQKTIETLGFGVLQPVSIISFNWAYRGSAASQILQSVLVANSPQVILSFLYLNLNGLMTSMWLAEEWHRFATQRKYLRVSSPKGKQRSTHFLQLPYKISIPLMIASGLLHWLLSRSIFLAVVSHYDAQGDLITPTLIGSCGYSVLPMIVTIVLGFAIMFMIFGLGFRRYDGRIPLVGSCSAAISAACHRPDWDHDAALKPLRYGQPLSDAPKGDFGHCCFTSDIVEFATEGRLYAGYCPQSSPRDKSV